MLDRVSRQTGEGRLPSWLSTHPAPEDRAQRLQAAITAGRLTRRQGRPRGLPRPARRDGLRREPARGILRAERLLPPGAAVHARVPAGLEDGEPAPGGGRGEPEPGRAGRALPGPRDERGPGRARVLQPAGRAAGGRAARRDRRHARGDRGRSRPSPTRRRSRAGSPSSSTTARSTASSATRRRRAGAPTTALFDRTIAQLPTAHRPPLPRRGAAPDRGRPAVASPRR